MGQPKGARQLYSLALCAVQGGNDSPSFMGFPMGVGGSLPDTPDMRVQEGNEVKGLWNINFNDPRLDLRRKPISDIEIETARSTAGGFSRDTLARWGVPWPPLSGWRKAIAEYGVPLLPIDVTSKKTMKRTSKKAWELLAQLEQKPVSQFPEKRRRASVPKEARDEFYQSWDWRTVRVDVIKERGRRCECCGATPADKNMAGQQVKLCVDHIKPISRYWHLRLDKSNLQILCDECNQGKGAWDETDWRKAP